MAYHIVTLLFGLDNYFIFDDPGSAGFLFKHKFFRVVTAGAYVLLVSGNWLQVGAERMVEAALVVETGSFRCVIMRETHGLAHLIDRSLCLKHPRSCKHTVHAVDRWVNRDLPPFSHQLTLAMSLTKHFPLLLRTFTVIFPQSCF